MALTTSFSSSQNFSTPTVITLTDTSSGSNTSPVITSRRVYLRRHDGTYLVPEGTTTDYVVWPYADSSIDIAVLTKDYVIDVRVDWLTGESVEFTEVVLSMFSAYIETALYNLTQFQTSNKRLTSNNNYYENKMKVRVLVDDAVQAVTLVNDQYGAQLCLDMATELIENQQYSF